MTPSPLTSFPRGPGKVFCPLFLSGGNTAAPYSMGSSELGAPLSGKRGHGLPLLLDGPREGVGNKTNTQISRRQNILETVYRLSL